MRSLKRLLSSKSGNEEILESLNRYKQEILEASDLRAQCRLLNSSTITSMEQTLKQSIDNHQKHPILASTALTSLIKIAPTNIDFVQKFTKEIQNALQSESPMLQYYALALSYIACKDDRLAISQLLHYCIDRGLNSPLANCILLKVLANYINDSQNTIENKKFIAYIHSCLDVNDEKVIIQAAITIVALKRINPKLDQFKVNTVIAQLRNFLSASKPALRFASVRLLNELAETSSADVRFWSIHRIGSLCKLHLLNRRYKPGDDIIGILDFIDSNVACAKYSCILQCEETQQFILKQEFSLGFKRSDFLITIPQMEAENLILHCVLSFLFYIVDKNYSKSLFEDKAGIIELGPSELETKLFSCDFPIAIYTQ